MKKLIPGFVLRLIRPIYHGSLSYLGAIRFHFPSKKLIVIGVTGTKGKSTVVLMLDKILSRADKKVGVSSSIYFKNGIVEKKNDLRNSMPGRFFLHRLMSTCLKNGCEYFVMEVTSEGLAQNRHKGIDFGVGVFLNLYPEHLESHGGYENYRKAKGILFRSMKKKNKKMGDKGTVQVISNFSKEAEYYSKLCKNKPITFGKSGISDVYLKQRGEAVVVHTKKGELFLKLQLLGEFNLENALAAIAVAVELDIPLEHIEKALNDIKEIPGRMNVVSQEPLVIVDYAHIPEALSKVYDEVKKLSTDRHPIVAVLGACGGGRDKWKREPMGQLAGANCDYVIVTNEDPYDEDPQKIIDVVFGGVLKVGKVEEKNAFRILDRKEALQKALSIAGKSGTVVITGKGSENSIMLANGKRQLWNDTEEVNKLLGTVNIV
jgi:UDP-N-acetylmuramoyl-L-alanyl-D-glutamate--2,6-diaminopimelate ligase